MRSRPSRAPPRAQVVLERQDAVVAALELRPLGHGAVVDLHDVDLVHAETLQAGLDRALDVARDVAQVLLAHLDLGRN